MTLDLSDDEAEILGEMLREHRTDLNREIAHTDSREFRRLLARRLDVCERLLGRLEHVLPVRS